MRQTTDQTEPALPRPTSRFSNRALSGALCTVALLVAACGTGADAETTAVDAAEAASTATTEAVLSDSGLPTLDDGAEEGTDDRTDDDAADADGDANAEGDPEGNAASDSGDEDADVNQDAAIEDYFDCMREQGIDPDEITNASPEDAEALTSSPDFLAANAECEEILTDAFGTFELDAQTEAALADRSAEMAACGREVLGVEIPDNILLIPQTDPVWLELDAIETTPEQDAAIDQCFEDILGDIIDDDGNLIAPEGEE